LVQVKAAVSGGEALRDDPNNGCRGDKVDSACSEKKRKASQSKLRSFFSLEKRQKGESNVAGEEVQSEFSTSIN